MDMHEKISAFAKALDVSSEYLVSRKEDEKEVTATSKSVAAGGFVGAFLLAKPFSFVGARQHAPGFPDLPAALLAPSSPQSLCPSSRHANTLLIFPTRQIPVSRQLTSDTSYNTVSLLGRTIPISKRCGEGYECNDKGYNEITLYARGNDSYGTELYRKNNIFNNGF